MKKVILISMMLVLPATAPSTVLAARVSGRITGAPPPAAASMLGYGKFQRRQTADAVPHPMIVILERHGSAGNAATKAHLMNQRNQRFTPRALVVRTGDTVDFLNSDSFYHNVFSLSSPRKFDLGRYRKGSTRSVTFRKPGLVKLFCDIHPNMIGYVLVTDSPWYASATPRGEYAIEDIPAGDYTVSMWHEQMPKPVPVQDLRVDDEDEVQLDLTAPTAG